MKNTIVKLGILTTSLFCGGIAYKKYHMRSKKYKFVEELNTPFHFTFPAWMVNPIGAKVMNMLSVSRGKGVEREDVITKTVYIPTYDGTEVVMNIFEPLGCGADETLPCLLYIHGGGYILEAMPNHFETMAKYANKIHCKVALVHYRTMFQANADACVEDSYSALLWLYENADKINIDKERIAVGGDSAGGGISAALMHLTRDRKGPKLAYSMLFYPVVDSTLSTESMKKYTDSPGWNAKANRKMWKEIKQRASAEMMRYIAPIFQTNFMDLCDAYIEVEEYDCLHDEGVIYAKKLMEGGSDVYLNDMKGTYHGFEQNSNKPIAKKIIDDRAEVLRKVFYHNLEND